MYTFFSKLNDDVLRMRVCVCFLCVECIRIPVLPNSVIVCKYADGKHSNVIP